MSALKKANNAKLSQMQEDDHPIVVIWDLVVFPTTYLKTMGRDLEST